MSLSSIFRLFAAFGTLWAIQLIVFPDMMFQMYGWTDGNLMSSSVGLSLPLYSLAQAAGIAMLGLAILGLGIPNWTSAVQLKSAAKSFCLITLLFTLLQLYQIFVSQSSPGSTIDWISISITALFMIGFFMKSR
tara:strand:+ start:386 stop:787 length:402 start_codon:yes stop_codon:yes gene_type:complete